MIISDLRSQYNSYLLNRDTKTKELDMLITVLTEQKKELIVQIKDLYSKLPTIDIKLNDVTDMEKVSKATIRRSDNYIYFDIFKDNCKVLNSIIFELKEAIKSYNSIPPIISYVLYFKIISTFFKNLQGKLLDGYVWNPGYNIGEICIAKKKNYFKDDSHLGTHHNNRRVNWGSSIKLRNTLLKENKELYNKYTGKGEKYLIYIDSDFSFWLYWRKVQCKIKNKIYFSFKPILGNTHLTLDENATLEQVKASNCGFIKKIKHIEQFKPELHNKFVEV